MNPVAPDAAARALQRGRGGLPCLLLADGAGARAEVYTQGAQLTRWMPAGERASRLFLSATADFGEGRAIRGGVPVIFPQFGAEGPLPRHGFARQRRWEWLAAESGPERALFRLTDSPETLAIWPQRFELHLALALAGPALSLTLTVDNAGETPLRFTAALHSYFAVDDLLSATLEGLENCRYREAGGSAVERAAALRFDGDEIDRIYFDTPPQLLLREPARALRIEQEGFTDTVVWNPGRERAAALADLEPGGWQQMLCVEAAVIGRPVTLDPGARWQGEQRLIAA